ncbi:methyl viologen-reducing hydrogenase [Desulfobulbus alkaliphilus]|uniref:NADH-quinone oxidoreductase subunit B family protein n=1 Tax=Desulfobulbus alkaliphilus TaxID=869814 RepID=UPI0019651658|nr:methyl viologen-reducing hydrogenase [Desulfobulbus alkaliphilus]MBM9535579.1 methyl viologen-reducing hydrogenase [Desulfobulbus alkaliphilus]
MKPRLNFEWLHGCSGCEIALLNSGELLFSLFQLVDIVHFPLLMDHKYIADPGEEGDLSLPEADIGLVTGGVGLASHLKILTAMRRQCRVLIAVGTCAGHGGIPAMRNQWTAGQTMETVFSTATTDTAPVPDGVPALLDRVSSIDEQVRVDVCLPGCPPRPEMIIAVLEALIQREEQRLPHKSVCETCPTVRTGKGQATIHRGTVRAAYTPGEPLDRMRCLLEQGLLCMGPVTAGGCGGRDVPLCLRSRVSCRGCYGPVRKYGNQLLDMMNALASNGIDYRTIIDRTSLLRFSGAHGRLRPKGERK